MGLTIAQGYLCITLGSAANTESAILTNFYVHNLPPTETRTDLLKTIVAFLSHNRMVLRIQRAGKMLTMTEDESPEKTIKLSGVPNEEAVCPFSCGKWKRAGDALVFFMLFVTPFLFLLALIMTSFN
jgi:hypothetical protein